MVSHKALLLALLVAFVTVATADEAQEIATSSTFVLPNVVEDVEVETAAPEEVSESVSEPEVDSLEADTESVDEIKGEEAIAEVEDPQFEDDSSDASDVFAAAEDIDARYQRALRSRFGIDKVTLRMFGDEVVRIKDLLLKHRSELAKMRRAIRAKLRAVRRIIAATRRGVHALKHRISKLSKRAAKETAARVKFLKKQLAGKNRSLRFVKRLQKQIAGLNENGGISTKKKFKIALELLDVHESLRKLADEDDSLHILRDLQAHAPKLYSKAHLKRLARKMEREIRRDHRLILRAIRRSKMDPHTANLIVQLKALQAKLKSQLASKASFEKQYRELKHKGHTFDQYTKKIATLRKMENMIFAVPAEHKKAKKNVHANMTKVTMVFKVPRGVDPSGSIRASAKSVLARMYQVYTDCRYNLAAAVKAAGGAKTPEVRALWSKYQKAKKSLKGAIISGKKSLRE
mmetsp:Transcript_1401/g.3114  ORF Transcript_1401/g.3114 Transcript_1401/m.3114 type:complete len:461 (-) Transcript_1401:55-1437(-)